MAEAEANIQAFMKTEDSRVFSVAAKDRFGDHGIIGVIILKMKDDECLIDTFLLSCRVISRNIENIMIAFIADFARKHEQQLLTGEYLPTAKNKPAADMYEKFRFRKETDTLFRLSLKMKELTYPEYIKRNIQFDANG